MRVNTATIDALTVYLPDSRGVEVSRFGKGNLKIGPSVYTYSRQPGRGVFNGTCPGSTDLCESICYAKRIHGPVRVIYRMNSETATVPELPADCRLLRLHISGDFDSPGYIQNWQHRLMERPDVTCWAYTRSWRVPSLLPALERLRALPNVQLFASIDHSTVERPPSGWRVAWMDGDRRAGQSVPSYLCPEQTGVKATCEACRYCFDGRRNDVTFLEH